MAAENAFPAKQVDEFVGRLKDAAGDNVESIVLYGSAVTGDYDPEFSNINLLCIVRDTSFAKLKAISPPCSGGLRKDTGRRSSLPRKS